MKTWWWRLLLACTFAALAWPAARAADATPPGSEEAARILALADDDPRRAIALAKEALSRFDAAADPARALALNFVIVDANVWLAEYQTALDLSEPALASAVALRDVQTERWLRIARGFSHQYLNDPVSAQREMTLALQMAQRAGATGDAFRAHLLLAGLLSEADAGDLALAEIEAARGLLAADRSVGSMADVHYQLALTHRRLGEFDRALAAANAALFADRAAPTAAAGVASAMWLLGAIHLDRGAYEQAEVALRSALAVQESVRNQYDAALARRDLAAAACARGRLQEAQSLFAQALRDFQDVQSQDQQARVQAASARCMNLQRRPLLAVAPAEEARRLATASGAHDVAQRAMEELVEARLALHQWQPAALLLRDLARQQADSRSAQLNRQIAIRTARLELANARSEPPADGASAPRRTSELIAATAAGMMLAGLLLVGGRAGQAAWRRRAALAWQASTVPPEAISDRGEAVALLEGLRAGGPDAYGQPPVCAIAALGGLAELNRREGWAAGDARVVSAVRQLQQVAPPPRLVARIGGNRVLVVLGDVPHDAAMAWLEAARLQLADPARAEGCTVRFAASRWRGEESIGDYLERLDFLLLDSRREGGSAITGDGQQLLAAVPAALRTGPALPVLAGSGTP